MQVERFAADVTEASKGTIKINAFLGAQLGSEQDTIQQVARGRIDMGGFSLTAGSLIVPELSILSIPFLFKDAKEQDCVLDSAPVAQVCERQPRRQGRTFPRLVGSRHDALFRQEADPGAR